MEEKRKTIIGDAYLVKRKVLTEKKKPDFLIIKFGEFSISGRIYLDNFCMPESLYVISESLLGTSIPVDKIVCHSDIIKKNDGYYAENLEPFGVNGELYLSMLKMGKISLRIAGTGVVNQDGVVNNYNPICLFFEES